MDNYSSELYGPGELQEFACKAITDPAKLEALRKRLRRPVRWSSRVCWIIAASAAVAALLVGLLVGHFLL